MQIQSGLKTPEFMCSVQHFDMQTKNCALKKEEGEELNKVNGRGSNLTTENGSL